jgi:hypothetical protein
LAEFQPSLTVTADPAPGDQALTSVSLTASGPSGAYFTDLPFSVATGSSPAPTALNLWVDPTVTVTAAVSTGSAVWPGATTSMTNSLPSGTIALSEKRATVKVTVERSDASTVAGAHVDLNVPAGSGFTPPAQATTDGSGVVTFTVPYGSGWTAAATAGTLSGTSAPFDTGSNEADVTVTITS